MNENQNENYILFCFIYTCEDGISNGNQRLIQELGAIFCRVFIFVGV